MSLPEWKMTRSIPKVDYGGYLLIKNPHDEIPLRGYVE